MRIGLLHYSGPPTVGGVEQTLLHHALALSSLGHAATLLVGVGRSVEPRLAVEVIPELSSRHPQVLAVKAELDGGRLSPAFEDLTRRIKARVREAVAGLDVLVVHNALTLHKNLALTAALWRLLEGRLLPRTIGWHHDFAWDRPGYRRELHPGEPWELLRRPWPGVTPVVVSAAQRDRLARLYGLEPASIHVVPPGVDPALSGGWTEPAREIVAALGLLQADAVLLLPARLTRRKNVEYALHVLAALRRASGRDVRLLVTGPPGPHNPANQAYLESLLELRRSLDLDRAAHFLYRLRPDAARVPDDPTMASLFGLCDALLFPSHDEGFGIPLLEAGLARLPVFCSDIPPFRETAGDLASYFPLDQDPAETAADLAARLFGDPAFQLRARVRAGYTWERIVAERVLPLLEGAGGD